MNELEGRCDGIDTLPLFDIEPVEVVKPELVETLSAGRRLTLRQAEDIKAGRHPLGRGIFRHPDTLGEEYSRDDKAGRDLTCGTCVHRVPGGMRSFPKCDADGGRRITGGPASDVRSWWSACRDWEPK
jgi:hypothetical protein